MESAVLHEQGGLLRATDVRKVSRHKGWLVLFFLSL